MGKSIASPTRCSASSQPLKAKKSSPKSSQTARRKCVSSENTVRKSSPSLEEASRKCVCSENKVCETSPSLKEVKPSIRKWLKENLKELIFNAACRYTTIRQKKHWTKYIDYDCKSSEGHCIENDVFNDNDVKRFPCFFNVSRATFKVFRKYLKKLCCEGNSYGGCCEIRFMVAGVVVRVFYPWKRNCKYNFDEDKVEHDKESQRSAAGGFILNPAVHREFGKVHGKLLSGVDYWDIICRASKFDRDPCSFHKYFVREELKIKKHCKLKRQNLVQVVQVLSKIREELAGVAEAADKLDQFINSVQKGLQISPFDEAPELHAILSISHGMAQVMPVLKDNKQRCLDFWKDRYVFSGRKTKGTFTGVALDTITGKIWNAEMKYGHQLCPREGWECTLSDVTEKNWKKYVESGQYSLIAFDDGKRFTPTEGIFIRYPQGVPSNGSILLSPI